MLRGDSCLLLVHGRRADQRSLKEVHAPYLAGDALPLGAEPAVQRRSRKQRLVARAAGMTFVAFIAMMAVLKVIQTRVSGKDKSWANTGANQ